MKRIREEGMEASIFIDTNVLHMNKITNFTELQFIDKIALIIEEIKINKFEDRITIALPKIVVNELIQQQKSRYIQKIDSIKELKFPLFQVTKQENYEESLMTLLNKYIHQIGDKNVNINIINYPSTESFYEIIDRSIHKRPPFLGVDKQSDKGFKDVVLWESLLEYKKLHINKKIILLTHDAIFGQKELKDEYYKKFGEEVIIVGINTQETIQKLLIEKLGELFNTQIEQTYESKIFNKFNDLIYNSNFADLFNGAAYRIYDRDEHLFNKVDILKINYFDHIQRIIVDKEPISYFVIEMELEFLFVNVISKDFVSSNKIHDYYEFEIYYYEETQEFGIIGFDEPIEEIYHPERFILKRNKVYN